MRSRWRGDAAAAAFVLLHDLHGRRRAFQPPPPHFFARIYKYTRYQEHQAKYKQKKHQKYAKMTCSCRDTSHPPRVLTPPSPPSSPPTKSHKPTFSPCPNLQWIFETTRSSSKSCQITDNPKKRWSIAPVAQHQLVLGYERTAGNKCLKVHVPGRRRGRPTSHSHTLQPQTQRLSHVYPFTFFSLELFSSRFGNMKSTRETKKLSFTCDTCRRRKVRPPAAVSALGLMLILLAR